MMSRRLSVIVAGLLLFFSVLWPATGTPVAGRKAIFGQVPAVVETLRAIASLPATNQLRFAIALPLQDQAGLADLLRQLYTPGSPNYRHFLTPAQFGVRFGPPAADYQTVLNYLTRNGLTVVRTYPDHSLVEVSGPVSAIEATFQTHLRVYHHPLEARTFYSPDSELTVDTSLPVEILGVSGLDNYALPKPVSLHRRPLDARDSGQPKAGSGPGGDLMGQDFRFAYLPSNKWNGKGQSVALLEFDGYYSNDITAYETLAKLPPVPLANVAVNGGVSTPGSADSEVCLDIEMVISIATNLSRVVVYEAPAGTTWQVVLKQIADDDSANQISSSWYSNLATTDAASEQVFEQMAAQGQSFFEACGDYDAFVGGSYFPQDSPHITLVGGTLLTTITRSGGRSTETVWNRGYDSSSGEYVGTGGGVSASYSIPTWQQGINSVLRNGGSTTMRNVPDVAMAAEDIYITSDNGSSSTVGGTSCAAPLWAGVLALANQRAATVGQPVVGFINPTIYELANESVYNTAFFDVTVGSNAWPSSPSNYFAVPGYDLCTGLGTPKGTNLLNLLVSPDPLSITPVGGFNAVGSPAGVFTNASEVFFLTNSGSTSLAWSMVSTSVWLTVSNGGGTLAAGAGDSVIVSLSGGASNLIAGIYSSSLWFSNVTTRVGHSRFITLQTVDPLVLDSSAGFAFYGPPNGPFAPTAQTVAFTNLSYNPVAWTVNNTSVWLNVSPLTGTLAAGAMTNLTLVPAPAATNLADGQYAIQIQLTNLNTTYAQSVAGEISVGLIQNGGFETGDLTDWTLVGDTSQGGSLYNGVINNQSLNDGTGGEYVHSGEYGMFLGDTILATLSQSFATVPGEEYQVSFWVDNPTNGAGQEFLVNWITNGVTDTVFSLVDPPELAWTNVVFVITAGGTNTTLQFAAENPPGGFGLDDVAVDPLTPPIFTSQPTNLTVYTGQTAVLSGSVKGLGSMSYRWWRGGVALADGGNVAGSATGTLTISPAYYTNSGSYVLVVTNNYGAVTSSVAVLTVLIPPTIGAVGANTDGSFNLNLAGTPGATYVLEAATNLQVPINWYPIATNILGANGAWEFTDFSATNHRWQFYRLRFGQ
jgi:hypothetical protein